MKTGGDDGAFISLRARPTSHFPRTQLNCFLFSDQIHKHLVAVLPHRRPVHARRGAESLLSDCSVMRWLPFITAPPQTLWRVMWASSWRFVAARGPHGNEVLTERPWTRREGPCEIVQLRATTRLQPMKASRLRELGAASHAEWSKSPQSTCGNDSSISSSALPEVLIARGPHHAGGPGVVACEWCALIREI